MQILAHNGHTTSSTTPMRVVDKSTIHIIDYDESVREALATLFGSVGFITATYQSAREFLQSCDPTDSGCIVLDVRLPDMNGLDFQARLLGRGIGLPVVFVTSYGDVSMSVRAMKQGAVDFLTKPFHDQDILDAVIVAVERDRLRRAAEDEAASVRRRFESLSLRERQVMMLATAGKLNKQIAGHLGISEVTVKGHRGSVMRKMRARTLIDLYCMAESVAPRRP